ncbi:hypothetical protein [Bacillus sp. NPDC094106]|uniref:hypothetical protein n=1 Tax=Bacillus sp. NPDC094106 TaxID=3363949 RepID=UPI0037FCAA49
MDKLKVIAGIEEKNPDYFDIYLRMFTSAVRELQEQKIAKEVCSKESYKKAIFAGVRFVRYSKNDTLNYDYLINKFQLIGYLQHLMGALTPREFINIFPITKEYDGDKWGEKDYFFTMKRAKEIGMDTPIGEKVLEFLYDYTNLDMTFFTVSSMTIMSRIRQVEGKKSLAEEFCEKLGVDTYTMHTDQQGKQQLTNNRTGETQEVKKARPRYLKPVE